MVSKRLARLEARLGARLIHRTTRRLSLTSAGTGFHGDVIRILDAIEVAEAAVSGFQNEVRGTLRVTAPTAFGRLFVAPYLKPFLDRYPQVKLRLDLSDGLTDLLTERIDLAIRIAPWIGPGLTASRLASSRRILCAAPAYLARYGSPAMIDDLARHHILAADGQMPWRLQDSAGTIVMDPPPAVQTNSSEVVRELALAGIGIALRSFWEVGQDIVEGRLEQVLPAYEGSIDVGIYAVHPGTMPIPRTTAALIDHLSTLYRSPPWEHQ